jgi:hypothetical protein
MTRIGIGVCMVGWLAAAGCGVYGSPERYPEAATTAPAAEQSEPAVPTRTLPAEDEFREDEENPAAQEPVR